MTLIGTSRPKPIDFEESVHMIFMELEELLIKKHHDYGPTNIAQSPGGAMNGLVVRMWDKFARIRNLSSNKWLDAAENEPLEDSFKDMAGYSVIGMLVLRGQWPNE